MNQHVFIGGFPSGGTDLLKTILNAHPEISIVGELPFLYRLPAAGYTASTTFTDMDELQQLVQFLRANDPYHNLQNIEHDFTADLAAAGRLNVITVLQTLAGASGCAVWGNKTPQNTEHLTELFTLDPDSKAILIARDVRDVCLSWRKKWGKHIYWCASKWSARMYQGWLFAKEHPQQVSLVKFEDLLSDPKNVTEKVATFLGVEWTPQFLEHHKYTQAQDGKLNYGKPILADNTNKWSSQMHPKAIRRIEEIAFETMHVLDYDCHYAKSPRALNAFDQKLGFLHDLVSMLFIGNRAVKNSPIKYRMGMIQVELKKRF